MRVSVDKNDDGYRWLAMLRANGKTVHVFLDDVEVHCCITADEELGFVERDVLNADGCPQIDPVRQDRWWTEVVKGRVRIDLRTDEHGGAT